MKPVHILVIIIGLCSAVLRAATLSTLALEDAGYDLVSYNSWAGQSFTLTTTADTGKIQKTTVLLEIIVPNGNLVVRIVGSIPGSAEPDMSNVYSQLSLVKPSTGASLQPVLFEEDLAFASKEISAGATYWIVIGMTGEDMEQTNPSGIVRMHYAKTSSQSPDAPIGWNVGDMIATSGTGGVNWSTSTNSPYLFSAEIAVVPEPGITSLLIVAGLLSLRRRL